MMVILFGTLKTDCLHQIHFITCTEIDLVVLSTSISIYIAYFVQKSLTPV